MKPPKASDKSFVHRHRGALSRGLAATVSALIIVSASAWEGDQLICDLFFLAGTVLAGVATAGLLWAHMYQSGYRDASLVTCGPYSLCRNPIYLFGMLGATGVGLTTETLTIFAIVFIASAALTWQVVKGEEAYLEQLHGESYRQYLASTSRFWPSLSRLREPDGYLVRPALVRRKLIMSARIVWALGLVELVGEGHLQHFVPILAHLY